MKIERTVSEAGVHLIRVNSPLDSSLAEAVRQTFEDAKDDGAQRVVVNLEDVSFIDSRGLTALVAGLKLFGNDARNFRLVAPQAQPRLMFELTGFDEVFQIFDNVAEAVTQPSLGTV